MGQRRALDLRAACGLFAAMVLAFAVGTSSCDTGHRQKQGLVHGDRWTRAVSLDEGRFHLDRAAPDDHSDRSRREVLEDLRTTSLYHTSGIRIKAAGLARVTVRDANRRPLPHFDRRLAWVVAFTPWSESGGTSCPNTFPTPGARLVKPGDFSSLQLFVIADDGAALQYSQSGSWFCGLPFSPDVAFPTQSFATDWRPIDARRVLANVPTCVPQRQPPYGLEVLANGSKMFVALAFRPFAPAHCGAVRETVAKALDDPPGAPTASAFGKPIECQAIYPESTDGVNCRLRDE